MSQLRQQFANRLKRAMEAADMEPRPSVLVNAFNLEYRGKSVAFETASRWLSGEALPDPEKIQTLARVLGVGACHLLFGESGGSVREPGVLSMDDLRAIDRKMLATYRGLGPEQRKLVRDLVEELDRAKPG